MRLNTPRIPPVEPANWTEEQSQALGMDIEKLQANIGSPNQIFNIVKTLIRYPALFKAWLGFANHVMFDSSLAPRDREIVILRIGWLCQSGYEFGQHIIIGRDAGLNDGEIKAIAEGNTAANWSEAEQALIQATDELLLLNYKNTLTKNKSSMLFLLSANTTWCRWLSTVQAFNSTRAYPTTTHLSADNP